jgi:hypothetical protein
VLVLAVGQVPVHERRHHLYRSRIRHTGFELRLVSVGS